MDIYLVHDNKGKSPPPSKNQRAEQIKALRKTSPIKTVVDNSDAGILLYTCVTMTMETPLHMSKSITSKFQAGLFCLERYLDLDESIRAVDPLNGKWHEMSVRPLTPSNFRIEGRVGLEAFRLIDSSDIQKRVSRAFMIAEYASHALSAKNRCIVHHNVSLLKHHRYTVPNWFTMLCAERRISFGTYYGVENRSLTMPNYF